MSESNQSGEQTNQAGSQQNASFDVEHAAQEGHNAVASDKTDRTLLQASDMATGNDPDAGQLEAYGDDAITTDRVRTELGRMLHADHLQRLNINTQAGGVVYLRGPVSSQEQSNQIEQMVSQIKGVGEIVNELHIEQEMGGTT